MLTDLMSILIFLLDQSSSNLALACQPATALVRSNTGIHLRSRRIEMSSRSYSGLEVVR